MCNRKEMCKVWEYPSTKSQSSIYINRDGVYAEETEELLTEYALRVYVNGQFFMTLVCTPDDLEALVIGRLYTDGFIQGLEEIVSLEFCEKDFSVQIVLQEFSQQKKEVREQFVDTDNMGLRLLWPQRKLSALCCQSICEEPPLTVPGGYQSIRKELPVTVPGGCRSVFPPEWIYTIAEIFEKDTILHRKTYGTHSCFLGMHGDVVYSCEDIGRHNAIDKVVGKALMAGLDLTQTIIFTSGRIPLDMVEKVIRAKIPVFVTKAKPTIQSVECANAYGLTLIGSAKHDSFKVYTSEDKIGGIS